MMKLHFVLIPLLLSASCSSINTISTPSLESVRPTQTLPVATKTSVIAAFPEELKQILENWVARQDYGTAYLEPTIQYASLVIEANPVEGWDVSVERVDRQKDYIFTLSDNTVSFQIDGETKSVSLDRVHAETDPDDGGYVRLRIREGGENDPAYMWRYPWGGWVTDAYKIFSENGVSIIANEAKLYGGLFTINPEQVEEYWEDTVSAIYYVQTVTKNIAITSRFPTVDSFIKAARSGAEISDLRRLIGYPGNERQFIGTGSWLAMAPIVLQEVSFEISQLSASGILDYKYRNFEFFHYQGEYGHVNLVPEVVNGTQIFRLKFENATYIDKNDWNLFAMNESGSVGQNFRAATQMIRNFLLRLQRSGAVGSSLYYEAGRGEYKPEYPLILLRGQDISLSPEELLDLQKTKDSVLILRP